MTKVFRSIAFLKVALAVGLVALFAGTPAALATVEPHTTPSATWGESVQITSQLGTSFCIDVAPGGAQGRALRLWVCQPSSSERWTFTKNSDGSNLFVDSQGMCVDSVGRKAGDGISVKVRNCSFVKSQRFRVTSVGRIQLSGTTTCLSIPRAGAGVAVFLETCSNAKPGQVFKMSQ
jgi:hypothetical protein